MSKKRCFQQFISQIVRETACFFCHFHIFWVAWKAYLTSTVWPPPPPPQDRALPPPIVSAPSRFELPTRSLALSKCRSGASNCGRGMTQSLPLSYWSPEKSYMTSSRTATLIYIASRFSVKYCTFILCFRNKSLQLLRMHMFTAGSLNCGWCSPTQLPLGPNFATKRPNTCRFTFSETLYSNKNKKE